jgi:hypothetical protein
MEVLRHHNRALRNVNKSLRSGQKSSQEHSDELFLELCKSETDSQIAMEKIRAFGGIECGSGDYSFIVDKCLQALSAIDQSK